MDRDRAELQRLLKNVDPAVLDKCEKLEGDLKRDDTVPPPIESVRVWLNPDSICERAEHAYGGLARKLEFWRNAFILFPLIITWLSLAHATTSFNDMVSDGLVTENQTFLGLWEDGFDNQGLSRWLHFSYVAIADAVILIVIAGFSVWHHLAAQRAAEHVRTLRQLLERRLQDLIDKVDERRTKLHSEMEVEKFTSAFGAMGETLVRILEDTEKQRERLKELASQRDLELGKLAEVSSNMKEGSERIVTLIDKAGGLAGSLGTAASTVEAAAGAVAASSKDLVGLRADLQRSLDKFTADAKSWSDGMVSTWGALQKAHIDALHAELEKGLRDLGALMTDAPLLKESADQIGRLNGAVGRLDRVLDAVHKDAEELGAALHSMATYFGGIPDGGHISIEREDGFLRDDEPRR